MTANITLLAVVGVLGGLVATWKAARIEPADALRAAQ